MLMKKPLGYRPKKISTLVDTGLVVIPWEGYRPKKISTLVDELVFAGCPLGYRPKKISTLVDMKSLQTMM